MKQSKAWIYSSGALCNQRVKRGQHKRRHSHSVSVVPQKGTWNGWLEIGLLNLEFVLGLMCGVGRGAVFGVGVCLSVLLQAFDFTEYQPKAEKIQAPARIFVIGFGMCVLLSCVVCRLYDLQSQEYHRWVAMASSQQDSAIKIAGARGSVKDAMGRPLAVSVQTVSVALHPQRIKDADAVSQKLAPLVGMSAKDIREIIEADNKFVWLKRGLPRSVEHELSEFGIKGVSSFREFKRFYPQGTLASPILGRVGRDGNGQSGIEQQYDDRLVAMTRSVPVRRDARGKLVAISREENRSRWGLHRADFLNSAGKSSSEAGFDLSLRAQGSDIELTIDSQIQRIIEEELLAGSEAADAVLGAALLMDAESGEIIAMAQVPRFDPNSSKISSSLLRNVLIQNSFEPGSTLKPIVAAAALQRGVATIGETLDCENGRMRVGRHTIRDVHGSKELSFGDVLVRSSNVCMTKLGLRMGKKTLHTVLQNFGFGMSSNLDLPGESKGILRPFTKWAEVDVATHSFGQGVAVTALQLVRAYAVIANGGYLVEPSIVKSEVLRKQSRRILDANVAKNIYRILIDVTESEHGTGKKAAIPGLRVAGKTGTAQKPNRNGKGYAADKVLASFVGMVDISSVGIDRKLVMFVMIDEPGVKPRWGGTVAAPVFQRSMQRIVSYLMTVEGGASIRTAAIALNEPVRS